MNFHHYYFLEGYPNKRDLLFNKLVKENRNLELDVIGILQYLKFHYPLYNRTFVNEIKSGYSWDNGDPIIFKYEESRNGYSEKNEVLLWEIIKNSLNTICEEREKVYGVGNSGGLDSRIILYILNDLKVNFVSYTFGEKNSDAVYIANKTAKKLGFSNENIDIEKDYFLKYWKIVIERKPMFSLIYAWYYSALRKLPQFDIHLTGFNGDNMMGSHLSRSLLDIQSRNQLYRYIYNHYSVVSDDLIKGVLKNKNLINDIYFDYLDNIKYSENTKFPNIFEEFNFKCRQLKFIINSINFDFCGNFEWKSPFTSKEFMDFALNLTIKERFNSKLYQNMAKSFMKELITLRFERSYLSLKDKNKLKKLIKKTIWTIDTRLHSHIYFKGSHKPVRTWLDQSKTYNSIKSNFETATPLFNEIFNIKYIIQNFAELFNTNLYFLFNLLTVKMWIENVFES